MKIAIAQLNFHIANLKSNLNKMIEAAKGAEEKGADLIVFSELAICGYPPLDLLENKEFVDECLKTVDQLAVYSDRIAMVVGGPSVNSNSKGKKLFNTAFFHILQCA